jgi:hypothetical protein
VVAVVETDAQDLVGPRDRSPESTTAEGLDRARRCAIGDDLAQAGERAGGKERLVEVDDDVTQIDEAVVIDECSGLL